MPLVWVWLPFTQFLSEEFQLFWGAFYDSPLLYSSFYFFMWTGSLSLKVETLSILLLGTGYVKLTTLKSQIYSLSLIPSTQFVMPPLLLLLLLLSLCLLPSLFSPTSTLRTLQFRSANHITSYCDTRRWIYNVLRKQKNLTFKSWNQPFFYSWGPFWFGFKNQDHLTFRCWVNICSSKINLLNTSSTE